MASLSPSQCIMIGKFWGYAALVLVTLIIGLPLFWMVSGARKSITEIYTKIAM